MDATQLAEIEERLDRIEVILEKPKGDWLERNVPLIVQTIVLIVAITVSWVRMEMKIMAIQEKEVRLQEQLDVESAAVRNHHEDTARHVDTTWKAEVRSDLNDIRGLLISHMSLQTRSARSNQ